MSQDEPTVTPSPPSGLEALSTRRLALELVAASFVVLVQELTLIRWLPSQVRVLAYYLPWMDGAANRADEWAITFTTDGSPPAEDAPDVTVEMVKLGSAEQLIYDLPAQGDGTTVKVRVQTRREDSGPVWVYSDGSAIFTATADAAGPAAPSSADSWPGLLPEDL